MSMFFWALAIITICRGVCSENSGPYHQVWNQYFLPNKIKDNALFGYSVAYQKKIDRLIIGSPRASQIGNVYTCPVGRVARESRCESLHVNKPTVANDFYNFWLGATVNAGHDFIMACSPRFAIKINDVTGTYGRCYSLGTAIKEISGLSLSMMSLLADDEKTQYHWNAYPEANRSVDIPAELLMDTLGWSSHVCKDNSILVGGPAMSIGRVMRYADVGNIPNLLFVDNANLQKSNKKISFNFGYSITSGKFTSNSRSEWYAVSTPYGTYGNGRVLFYSNKNGIKKQSTEVEGEVGSLFGAALSSMQSERKDVLLVGAPAFIPPDQEGYFYDVGAVNVYIYNEILSRFKLHRTLLGYKNGGYFGSAITSIGDHNHDKIDEVAIAAPYEDEGRGAVYIYSGDVVLGNEPVKWMQRITGSGPEHYLGWSLHAAADADDNGCNELVIGVPGNNTVIVLRCAAYVDVSFRAEFPDLTELSKTLQTTDASFHFDPCLTIRYMNPDKPKPINTEILIKIKIDHPNVTIVNSVDGAVSFKAHLSNRRPEYCERFVVLLPKDADYDYPIGFTMTASLVQNPLELPFDPNLVLMKGVTTLTKSIDTKVMPSSRLSYSVSTTIKDNYVIGSTDIETLRMRLANQGYMAFSPCIKMRVEGVAWASYPRACAHSGEWLTCIPAQPLARDKEWNETITLDTTKLTSANKEIHLYAELLTHCMVITGEPYNITIKLQRETNIQLNGISLPSHNVNVTRQALKETGQQIEHFYFIKNNGLTTWKDMVCNIALPTGVICSVYVGNTECTINGTKAICIIYELKKNVDTKIRIQMELESDSLLAANIKNGKEVKLKTSLVLSLGSEEDKQMSIKTVISLWEDATVPLWIIIVASLVGLLILVIFAWILHECGFFRRNKREEMIKRQSMRKSMMLRQSMIEGHQTDRRPLVVQEAESDRQGGQEDDSRSAFAAELEKAINKDPRSVAFTQ